MPNKLDFPSRSQLKDPDLARINVVIYVPSTKNVTHKISEAEFKKRINSTVGFLRLSLGGSTTIMGIGNYLSSQYGSVTERVAKVESFIDIQRYNRADLIIKKWLENKKKQWSQESIAYEYENNLIYVLIIFFD